MSLVGIQFKFPDWEKKVTRALPEIKLFIAATMQTNRGLLFDAEGAVNGHEHWAPLKFRSGQILSLRGKLRKSMAPTKSDGKPGPDGIVRFSGDVITIGTKLGYARMMNDGTAKLPGGVLKAKNGKALRIPVPQGAKAGPAAKEIQKEAVEVRIAKAVAQLSKMKPSSRSRLTLMHRIARLNTQAAKGEGPVKFIFRKSVKIPARPFDTWTKEDQDELETALHAKLVEVLTRG